MMKIGLIQASSGCDHAINLETVRQYASQGAESGCDVLCFPECFLTSYVPGEAAVLALSADDGIFDRAAEISARYSVDLLLGFMERDNGAFYITHGLFRKDGIREYYRKTHLGEREKQFFLPGKELKVLSLSNQVKIGIALCVENHYPQIAQTLALRGAEIIFAPHAVPRVAGERKVIWSKYIPTRSYDNRVYMACCNLWDAERFGGGCLVSDPKGEVTAEFFKDEAALLVCHVDTDLSASYKTAGSKHSRHYFPALRKPELYE